MSRTALLFIVALVATLLLTSASAWSFPRQIERHPNNLSKSILSLEPPTNLDKQTIVFSPFTKNSTYFELLVQNIPFTADEKDRSREVAYEFTVDTVGFKSKKLVSVGGLEYNSTLAHKPLVTEVLTNYEENASKHFVFKMNFERVKTSDDGYFRGLLFRFDVTEMIADPSISIKISARSIFTGRIVPLDPATAAPFSLLGSLDVSLTSRADKYGNKNFTIGLNNLETALVPARGNLIFYNYLPDYSFVPATNSTDPDTELIDIKCQVNDQILDGKVYNSQRAQDSTDLPYVLVSLAKLKAPLPIGSDVKIDCEEVRVHVEHTVFHFSEYWVVYTSVDHAHSTQYKPGTDRVETLVGYLFLFAILVSLVLLAIAIGGLIVCCKVCGCCCYAQQRQSSGSVNSNSYYRM